MQCTVQAQGTPTCPASCLCCVPCCGLCCGRGCGPCLCCARGCGPCCGRACGACFSCGHRHRACSIGVHKASKGDNSACTLAWMQGGHTAAGFIHTQSPTKCLQHTIRHYRTQLTDSYITHICKETSGHWPHSLWLSAIDTCLPTPHQVAHSHTACALRVVVASKVCVTLSVRVKQSGV
jgi:hypothetical protein